MAKYYSRLLGGFKFQIYIHIYTYIYINISQMGCTRHLSKNTSKVRCSNESLNMLIHRVYFFRFTWWSTNPSSYCIIILYVDNHPLIQQFWHLRGYQSISIHIIRISWSFVDPPIGGTSTDSPPVSPVSLAGHARAASNHGEGFSWFYQRFDGISWDLLFGKSVGL